MSEELRITSPCRVKLRCGFEGDVDIDGRDGAYPVVAATVDGTDPASWTRSGQYLSGANQPDPLDIVAILDAPPEPVIDGLKLEPGEWRCQKTAYGGYEGDVSDVVRLGDGGLRCIDAEGRQRVFRADGTCGSGCCLLYQVRKADPAKPDEPRLMEPLGEGLFWIERHHPHGKRAKCRVTKLPASGDFIGEVECRNGGFQVVQFRDDGGTMCGVWQLIRRVQAPTVKGYETVEEKRQVLLGETVRRKVDGQNFAVSMIGELGVDLRDYGFFSWRKLARDYERLDGSPLGIVTKDPFDT